MQSNQSKWTPVVLTLLCALTIQPEGAAPGTAPREVTELTFRPFHYGEYKDALAKVDTNDDDAVFEALAVLATGEPLAVIEQLKQPDYIALSQQVAKYVQSSTEDYLGAPADPDEVELLIPVDLDGQLRTSLRLTMPALKAVKIMKKLRTGDERSAWITAHCASLFAATDCRALSIPDWNQLQGRINDFLNEPAAFFQKTMST